MKTKNVIALVAVCLAVAVAAVLCFAGLNLGGSSRLIPAADGITRDTEFAQREYFVISVAEKAAEEAAGAAEGKTFEALYEETYNTVSNRGAMYVGDLAAVSKQGSDKIRVEFPEVSSDVLKSMQQLLTDEGVLEFRDSEGNVITDDIHVVAADSRYDSSSQYYFVAVALDEEGAEAFKAEIPEGTTMAISVYIDGATVVSGAACTQYDDQIVFGLTDYNTALILMRALETGRINADITVLATGSVPAVMSEHMFENGLKALGIAIVIVMVALIAVYKDKGFVAAIVMLLGTMLTLFFFGAIPYITLGTASFAGFLVTIALAVFCMIDLLERTNREIANGQDPVSACKSAFRTSVKRYTEYCGMVLMISLAMQYFGSEAVSTFTIVTAFGSALVFVLSVVAFKPLLCCMLGLKKPVEAKAN